ncbi:hypothetical protein FHT00_000070 [Sphingomonas insulae]|uniref:O-antigen ligase like membrane protein n=1 Tax=Sphingomonas insulae TaxID=424800 RepID=A0ABN1HTV1_9SPHN|nr:hypothetical protein [Sphingomonas insulae]NIJ28142.1 hypothetical protein [Sphingomonas insulae]
MASVAASGSRARTGGGGFLRGGLFARLRAIDVRWTRVALLVAVLPLFGQSFHYVKMLPPLWALSKAFPILSLPLCLLLFAGERPLGGRQLLVTFVWLLLVPTFISLVTFQQTFFVAIAAQVKLLPILYAFSFLALLRWTRPTLEELTTSFVICALITFVLLIAIWALAPQSAYSEHYVAGDSPLLAADSRGNRIRLPMFFGLIGILYAYRRFLDGWKPGWLLAWAAGFMLVFSLVRMRTFVLGMALMAAINIFIAASPRMKMVLIALIPFALGALFSVPYMASIFSTDKAFAFDVRWISTVKAIAFLGTNPLRWIFGVGTISPIDPAGMMTYFNHFFFLADITWMGVLFEFGIIGAVLILAIPVRGVWIFRAVRQWRDDPFMAALQDYLVYAILISEMFPMTMAPGELTMLIAIGVYRLEQLRAPSATRQVAA